MINKLQFTEPNIRKFNNCDLFNVHNFLLLVAIVTTHPGRHWSQPQGAKFFVFSQFYLRHRWICQCVSRKTCARIWKDRTQNNLNDSPGS